MTLVMAAMSLLTNVLFWRKIMSKTMKAIVMSAFGTPEVLSVATIAMPRPKNNEVLIKVEAAGINRLDHYIREGGVNPNINFPFILGSDAVGHVAELGSQVTQFTLGERVIPMPGYPVDPNDHDAEVLGTSKSYAIRGLIEHGAYAQYMVVPENCLLKETTGLPAELLAGLPMPLVTGVRAVKEVGEVKAGQYVLVHAGASSTGSMMIQVAKTLGAKVATTTRTDDKVEFLKSIGADLVISGNPDNTVELINEWTNSAGLDVVIDQLGGDSLRQSVEWVKPLGIVVLMGNVLGLESTIPVRSLFFPQKQIRGTLMGNVSDLEWGLEQVKNGNIKPQIDTVFTPEQATEAHQYLADGKALGLTVFKF
ncbi:Alcohol dehydrogenase [Moritella viscosa]|uniref:Alcohol dehydrogenase n=2 Tax=Moritella viscosa TaxID=80854 RepID=A0A1K9ZSU3_9GAMM|nr:Alcohol dehydrogenase [Moritella viscosa]SGY92285.1 Alcohol dehydrogenase [Moritella viscosa]SGZ02705.1 Alcohol dehydrogenase [Moritella viscosa]SHO02034.1 Alcohol dehydrogenase [Moritella viscosa]SHO02208.1 Alcohol dehydrogenase [Moritella viscosa]